MAGEVEDDEDSTDPEEWLRAISDAQVGHSPHVAGSIYGRELFKQSGTTMDRQAKFWVSSMDWHRFLGFASASGPNPSMRGLLGKRKRAPWEEEVEASNFAWWHQLQQMQMEKALQQMLGWEDVVF